MNGKSRADSSLTGFWKATPRREALAPYGSKCFDDHSNQDLIFISNKERRIKIWYLSQTQNQWKVVETARESLQKEHNSGAVNSQKWCSAENNKLPTNTEWDVDCLLLLSLRYPINKFSFSRLLQANKSWAKLAFFGVNFIHQKFCSCKKKTNMRYVWVQ